MSQLIRSRRLYSRLSALFIAAVAVLALPNTSAFAAPKADPCDTQANDTPSKLVACINTKDLWTHMQNFEAIAQANPGPDGHPSRNSGEPGYKASADYVAGLMSAAGYNVTIQPYTFTYYAFTAVPTFSEVSLTAHALVLGSEWGPGRSTGTANNAALQPAGGIVIPPTPAP